MKIFVPHSKAFDFVNKLYIPLRTSHLNGEHEFFLPSENGKMEITRDLIKSCDLVIAEVSMPSTGEGIEIGWADMFNVPIICIYEKGSKISRSLQYVAKEFIEYESPEDMLKRIESYLK